MSSLSPVFRPSGSPQSGHLCAFQRGREWRNGKGGSSSLSENRDKLGRISKGRTPTLFYFFIPTLRWDCLACQTVCLLVHFIILLVCFLERGRVDEMEMGGFQWFRRGRSLCIMKVSISGDFCNDVAFYLYGCSAPL